MPLRFRKTGPYQNDSKRNDWRWVSYCLASLFVLINMSPVRSADDGSVEQPTLIDHAGNDTNQPLPKASAEYGPVLYQLSDARTPIDLANDDSNWLPFDRDLLRRHRGLYWLKVDVVLANWRPPQVLSMRSLMACDIFWDTRLILSNGEPGLGGSEVPGRRLVEGILPETTHGDGDHTLLFRISSERWLDRGALFEHQNRLIERLSIDKYSGYDDKLDFGQILAIGFGGANLFVGIYFLIMYIGRREKVVYLLCSVCSLATCCLGILDNASALYNYPYPWHYPVWLGLATALVLFFLLIPMIFLYHFGLGRKLLWLSPLLATSLGSWLFAPEISLGIWLIAGSLALSLVIVCYALAHKMPFAGLAVASVLICATALLANVNLLYPSFSILMMLILATLIMQSRWERERYHDANLLASQLESQLLRKNIQPHFLMNSLTNVLEWVEVEPDKAAAFIGLLADEFRLFNRIADQQDIPIEDELNLCQLHLDIMGYRLRKTFTLASSGINAGRRIPPAVFHTLCENGISHNRYDEENVVFELQESRSNEGDARFRFKTPLPENSGRTTSSLSTGTGMKYIRARLAQSFGTHWKLKFKESGNFWVTDIIIPATGNT